MSTTSALTDADRSLPVTKIRVTIHTLRFFFESDTRSGNHASIFLIVDDGKSIRLNMTKAGVADTMGTYTESLCHYISSNTSLHNIDLIAAKGLTVQHCLDYIHNNHMERYKLADTGVGCRFWCKSVIQRFEAAGFIDSSSPVNAEKVAQELQYNYTVGQAPEFEEIEPGTFV